MSFATFRYSSAIMSAQRPTHSLQIFEPSEVMIRKTSSGRLPQNEQFPLLMRSLSQRSSTRASPVLYGQSFRARSLGVDKYGREIFRLYAS